MEHGLGTVVMQRTQGCVCCMESRTLTVKQLNPTHVGTHTSTHTQRRHTLTYKLCLVIRQYGPMCMSSMRDASAAAVAYSYGYGYLRDITIAPVGFNFQAEQTHTHTHTRVAWARPGTTGANRARSHAVRIARVVRATAATVARVPRTRIVVAIAIARRAGANRVHVQRDIVTRPLIRSSRERRFAHTMRAHRDTRRCARALVYIYIHTHQHTYSCACTKVALQPFLTERSTLRIMMATVNCICRELCTNTHKHTHSHLRNDD